MWSPLARVTTSVLPCADAGSARAAVIASTTAMRDRFDVVTPPFAFGALAAALVSAGVRIAAERVRDVGDRALGTHAVAGVVERRRDDRDAELAGRDGDDTAADAALGGQAGVIEPLARVVVEAG